MPASPISVSGRLDSTRAEICGHSRSIISRASFAIAGLIGIENQADNEKYED